VDGRRNGIVDSAGMMFNVRTLRPLRVRSTRAGRGALRGRVVCEGKIDMKSLWVALLTLAATVPCQAYSCADVRALSPDQQAYYIKVFNITPALQERIRQFCNGSGAHNAVTASEERMLERLLHRGRQTQSNAQ